VVPFERPSATLSGSILLAAVAGDALEIDDKLKAFLKRGLDIANGGSVRWPGRLAPVRGFASSIFHGVTGLASNAAGERKRTLDGALAYT